MKRESLIQFHSRNVPVVNILSTLVMFKIISIQIWLYPEMPINKAAYERGFCLTAGDLDVKGCLVKRVLFGAATIVKISQGL